MRIAVNKTDTHRQTNWKWNGTTIKPHSLFGFTGATSKNTAILTEAHELNRDLNKRNHYNRGPNGISDRGREPLVRAKKTDGERQKIERNNPDDCEFMEEQKATAPKSERWKLCARRVKCGHQWSMKIVFFVLWPAHNMPKWSDNTNVLAISGRD